MRKVFWDDPYQSRLITSIASVNGPHVLLNETIAFSFSGGQESDAATINDLQVIDSTIKDHLIYYKLPDHHGLVSGDTVSMTIDWPRRYRLMRLHFAAELALLLVTRRLNVIKIGAHIGEQKARIDFSCQDNISVFFKDILSEYHKIIVADKAIKTCFSDVLNQKRYWEIDGFSRVPCGGTHVKSTKEVGLITLKRVNIGSGKERVEITLLSP